MPALLSVSLPLPVLVIPPVPVTSPDRVTALALSMEASDDRAMALSMVVAPVTVRLPPPIVSVPVPRLASPATDSVPALTVMVLMPVLPLAVLLVPPSTRAPAPLLVRAAVSVPLSARVELMVSVSPVPTLTPKLLPSVKPLPVMVIDRLSVSLSIASVTPSRTVRVAGSVMVPPSVLAKRMVTLPVTALARAIASFRSRPPPSALSPL